MLVLQILDVHSLSIRHSKLTFPYAKRRTRRGRCDAVFPCVSLPGSTRPSSRVLAGAFVLLAA
jgi:hypothetical protein